MTQANREAEQIQQMFNMDEDQTILQTPLMDVDQLRQTISLVESMDNFKLIKGKNGPTAFVPLGPNLGIHNKGRDINKSDNVSKQYLTKKQAGYVYRKVELGSLIHKNAMKEEIDQDVELDKWIILVGMKIHTEN